MSNYEREGSIRPPIFHGSNFIYWKVRTTTYLQSLGTKFWEIMEGGYTFPSAVPTDTAVKKKYETNAKAINTLLGSLSQSEFAKVMQLKTTEEIWDKTILSYEGDNQVKCAKLQSLRIQYETFKMHNDESIASYLLCIDEIVNCMKNLGEEIKEATLVEKVLRSLSTKFESKVSGIEEKQYLQNIREDAFKASGREELHELGHISEGEEEANFVKSLQRGSGRFRGKLPCKCFACGRVGHYATKCPHKDKIDKGKESAKWNRKQSVSKKSYYTPEDSDGLSNSDEDENSNEYRLIMAFEDEDLLDALDEDDLYEKISKLKICLEEKNMIIDTLTLQIAEIEKRNEKLECEIECLRKDIEKTKSLNLRFAKGLETLNEIIKVQHSPLINTGLRYTEEASQA
eukprot:PITA_29059